MMRDTEQASGSHGAEVEEDRPRQRPAREIELRVSSVRRARDLGDA